MPRYNFEGYPTYQQGFRLKELYPLACRDISIEEAQFIFNKSKQLLSSYLTIECEGCIEYEADIDSVINDYRRFRDA